MSTPRPGRSSSQSNGSIPNGKACRFCSRAFAKTEHLIRHERCHTKERPFQCSICGKNYSRNDTLIRHRRTHGNNTAPVAPDVFSNNDAATTSDGVDPPTPITTNHVSTSHVPTPHVPAPLGATEYQSPTFDSRPVEFPQMGNHMYNNDAYSASELATGGYQHSNGGGTGMPQIDPSLTGRGESLDGSANIGYSTSFLDPALQQYPQHPDSNGYPPLDQYVPPPADTFPSWYLSQDFDLASFNKSFQPPTAAEFLGLDGSHAEHQWNNHDMPSTETGGNLSLRIVWDRDLIPDTGFMNFTIQLFLTQFNPVFPIFHGPTFRPSDHSSLLLLSICSIGTLLMGQDATTLQAAKMFETVHKNITANWTTITTKPAQERNSFIQAAVLSQIFAYLSGNPKYLGLVKSFHVTLVDLARRCDLLETTKGLPQLENKSSEELDEAWKLWARSEEVSRTALGIYVQDAQFASTFHNAPILLHNASRLFIASSDELFAAATPTRWAHLIRLSPEPTKLSSHLHINQPEHNCTTPLSKELTCKDSRLSCYIILHSIGASVQASKAANSLTSLSRRTYEEALICWYHAYEETRTTQDPDPLCLMVLYHEIFMTLLVDFHSLERAIGHGHDGTAEGTAALNYARTWSSSIEAKRCIIHASLIHRQTEGIRYDSEPALHVPRSMFLAARAWFCYINFDTSDQGQTALTFDQELNIPEIKMFNIDPLQYLPGANGYETGKPLLSEAATLGRLTDLLEGVGHWGISRRFARILRVLIYGGGNGEGMGMVA